MYTVYRSTYMYNTYCATFVLFYIRSGRSWTSHQQRRGKISPNVCGQSSGCRVACPQKSATSRRRQRLNFPLATNLNNAKTNSTALRYLWYSGSSICWGTLHEWWNNLKIVIFLYRTLEILLYYLCCPDVQWMVHCQYFSKSKKTGLPFIDYMYMALAKR